MRARIGNLRANAGDTSGALEALEHSADLFPRASTWVDIGVIHNRIGNLEAALAAYDQALAIAPNYVPALHYAGRAALTSGDVGRARRLLGRAAEQAPEDTRIREALERARKSN